MKKQLTDEQINEIIKLLNEAIAEGPWEASNFLKAIGKQLQQIREDFMAQVQKKSSQKPSLEEKIAQVLGPGKQTIYITLYSSEGGNMAVWERILANLPRQVISRPIYSREEDAQYFIRSRTNRANEAYVAVNIIATDILALPEDKIPTDKFGKPLLTLKDRAISVENIDRFVHVSGEYRYIKGQLRRL